MKLLYFCAAILFASTALGFPADKLSPSDKIAIAKERCSPQVPGEEFLYHNDFKGFNRSIEDLDQMYVEIYNSESRLMNRVGYVESEASFVSKDSSGKTSDRVTFNERLIKAITLQIENNLKLDYVKYIFFPDMGHSHLFIPLDYYEREMSKVRGLYPSLETALNAPNLKLLYHTAEQLKMLDDNKIVLQDRYLQWRFYTRNPVGDMNGNIEILTDYNQSGGHNTVRSLVGHRYYSGFYLSANKNGCFPFEDKNGQIQYFDLSAWSLPYKPGEGDDAFPIIRGNSAHYGHLQKALEGGL